MMKHVVRIGVFALGALMSSGTLANAQSSAEYPAAEAGFNYTFTHQNPGGSIGTFNGNGGSGYLSYNINKTFSLVADLGAFHTANANGIALDNTTFTYLFGPRINWRAKRFTPYIQTLVGGARFSNAYDPGLSTPSLGMTGNAFAAVIGGGVDVPVTAHFTVKPFQVDYLMTQIPSSTANANYLQNGLRYSAGVVFSFGSK